MSRLLLPSTVFAALLACTSWDDKDDDGDGVLNGVEEANGTDPALADSDDDGLSDSAEADQGSDPLDSDSDGDGLDDGEEVDEYNTDPNEIDSDGDGYLDGDEVSAGSDPDDDDDVIYEGGWPYQADKDSFDGPDLDEADADEGEEFARIELMDQFGEMVDLYDFAGHGKPILLDVSAEWCPPCNGLSSWLAGERDDYNWDGSYPNIKEMVDNGDIYWITVLGQDNSGGDPDLDVLENWEEDYPNPRIPILAADAEFANTYVKGGWPSIYFLDENMEIQAMPVGTSTHFYDALAAADAYQP